MRVRVQLGAKVRIWIRARSSQLTKAEMIARTISVKGDLVGLR